TGNAILTVSGTGTAVNTFGSSGSNLTVTVNDTLDITISNTSVTSATGALSWSGSLGGTGGIIKDGGGTISLATATKAYSGSTVINAGALRVSVAGEPTATSSVTVNSGGTLLLGTTGSGTWQFGTSASTLITLNGTGSTTYLGGTVAGGIGALRSEAGSGT